MDKNPSTSKTSEVKGARMELYSTRPISVQLIINAVCAMGEFERAHEGCNFMSGTKLHKFFTKQRMVQNSHHKNLLHMNSF